jgi:Uma2 family endonuclease
MSEGRVRHGVEEYFQQDETLRPQELVWGYVREVPSPGPPHQDAVFLFTVAWQDHVADHGLGRVLIAPMDCVLDRERALVVQPGALFVGTGRAHIITDRVWGAADLVLEVLSPRPRIGTLAERLEWFAAYGVRECWVYDQPARQLDVLRFESGAVRERSRFDFHDRIVSSVFPAFDRSCASILTTYLRR